MKYPSVYDLSSRYGPPGTNLRQARIRDYHGDASFAPRPVRHRHPEDVSREDLEYYHDVFAFMEFRDLLFYLYPVAFECEKDSRLPIFFYLGFLERSLGQVRSLPAGDQEAVFNGLRWIWYSEPLYYDVFHLLNRFVTNSSIALPWPER